MSTASYGAESRRPVYSGNRRIPGLYERTLTNGEGVYEAALRLGGKVRRHRLEARTKTDAIAELRALQTDYDRGEMFRSPAAAITVTELTRDYLAHLDTRVGHRDPRQRRSARTVTLYRQRLEQHICNDLGHRTAESLTVADIRRLVDSLGRKRLSPSTVSSTVNIFSGLLRFGIKRGVLARNPVRDLDPEDRPGTARVSEPRYLDKTEIEHLLAELSNTFRPLAATCAFAGLRISEALGLHWCDIDFDANTITITVQLAPDGTTVPLKTTASAATLPLLPGLKTELLDHLTRQAARDSRLISPLSLVFITTRGRPQSRRNAFRAVQLAGDHADLNGNGRQKIGLHDLRHSFVAIALASGFTLPEAAALARHANPRVTAAIYAGLTDNARAGLATKLTAAFQPAAASTEQDQAPVAETNTIAPASP